MARMIGHVGGGRFQRRWLTNTWIGCFGGIPFATGLFGVLFGLTVLGNPPRFSAPVAIGSGAWMAFGLAMGIRSAMVAVYVTSEHLVVKNFWTTRRFRWAEIREIGRPRPFVHQGRTSALANRRNGLRIYLDDGRTVVATAYSPAGWDPPDFTDPVINVLQAEIARRHHKRRGAKPGR
jgi:hypothetical protein